MAKKLTQEEFIKNCVAAHGGRYDLSKALYINTRTKVNIVCLTHGDFYITGDKFTSGHGCSKCRYEKVADNNRISKEEFLAVANKAHHNKYNYSKTNHKTSVEHITVTCPTHGDFIVRSDKHLYRGQGCKTCGMEKSKQASISRRISPKDFVSRCVAVHGDVYDYSKTIYIKSTDRVTIVCKRHGEFGQIPGDHLDGHGCNKCPKVSNTSIGHQEISDFLNKNSINHRGNDRTELYPQELDIYIPESKLGIEFNGVYWHSEVRLGKTYHLEKYLKCKGKDIRLFQIWDVDWFSKREIIKSMIKSKLGIINEKVHGTKCSIVNIDNKVYSKFLEDNHLQGSCPSRNKIGLAHNGVIVAAAGFTGNNLDRYCQKVNTLVVGGLGKLIKYFMKENDIGKLYTFSDNMYSDGLAYLKLGFKTVKIIKPDYKYYDSKHTKMLIRKEHFRRSRLIKYSWFDPSKSESKNASNNGYIKVYDAGKVKWVTEKY